MALLDAAIRVLGVSAGKQLFPALRDLSVALAPPEDMVVVKTFGKSWRPAEIKESRNQKAGESPEAFEERMRKMEQRHQENVVQGKYPYYPTIAFREYVYYPDAFELALAAPDGGSLPDQVQELLLCINYFGKRGSFVQAMEPPSAVAQLPRHFILLTQAKPAEIFHPESTLQMLDDCDSSLTFERANVYNRETRVTLGKERILRHVVLPYRMARWSRGYSWYQRIADLEEEEE
jgi:hypothetical protein